MRNPEKDEIEMTAKRETMLAEGFRLFAEKGIAPVSMQEVAKAGRLGIATLYRYYSNKAEFCVAIAEWKWGEFFQENPNRVLMVLRHLSGNLRRRTNEYVEVCRKIQELAEKEELK